MIKNKKIGVALIVCILCSFMLVGCSFDEKLNSAEAIETVISNGRECPVDVFVPGMVVIKVSSEVADKIAAETDADGRLITTGVRSLDDMIPELGITYIERVFSHGGKFEARRRKAGLHQWFNVYFDEKTHLTRADATIKSAEGVLYMEYRPKIVHTGNPLIIPDMSNMVTSEQVQVAEKMTTEYGEGLEYFNDPDLSKQWHYYNDGTFSSNAKAGADINVLPVWKQGIVGSSDVIVAVLDQGVYYEHPDLLDNMWTGTDEEGNVIYGRDFSISRKTEEINNKFDYTIEPAGYHGTHVAGTIAAVNNNGIGVAGVAGGDKAKNIQGARIMTCQIFDINGHGNQRATDAMVWAADNGAVISQNSWAYTPGTDLKYYEADKVGIKYFIENAGKDENGNQVGPMAGGIVIFAAGNEYNYIAYPSSDEDVVAVSSIRSDYTKAPYANYGSWVDISAPGGSWESSEDWVYSTMVEKNNNGGYIVGYGKASGTSMACPHVSGVAALLISHFGGIGKNFTCEDLKEKLLGSVRPIEQYNPNDKSVMGAGLIDAAMAINGITEGGISAVTDLNASAESDFVSFSMTLPKDVNAKSIYFYYSDKNITEANCEEADVVVFDPGDAKAGEKYTNNISLRVFGKIVYCSVKILSTDYKMSTLSNIASVTTGVNNPPVITALDGDVLSIKQARTSSYRFVISDPDGHRISYKLDPAENWITEKYTEGNDTLVLSFNGNTAPLGTYDFNIVVEDEFEMETVLPVKYTVTKNNPPVIQVVPIPDVNVQMGDVYYLDMSQFIMDIDEDPLTVRRISEKSDLDVADIETEGSVVKCIAKSKGSMVVEVAVQDPSKASVNVSFKINVTETDNPLKLYPNPVVDILSISSRLEEVEGTIILYSSAGVVLLEEQVTIGKINESAAATVDMSGFPAGMYSVKVLYGDQVVNSNIVKL